MSYSDAVQNPALAVQTNDALRSLPIGSLKSGERASVAGLGYRLDRDSFAPDDNLFVVAASPAVVSAAPLVVNPLVPGRWLLDSSGGGGGGIVMPNRRDHSVNGAWVENWQNPQPVMRTQTNNNPAGGYNGGGLGNKAILGHYLPGPPYPAGGTMKLSLLASIEYLIDRITPEVSAVNIVAPYVNLMVLLNPAAPPAMQFFVVMVLADWGNVVPTGVFTPSFPPNPPVSGPGPNLIHMLWTPAGSLVHVVNFEGMSGPPAVGLWPVIVPKAFGPPGDPTGLLGGSAWPGSGYRIADILAVYPDAIIFNWTQTLANNDGGLPKLTTVSGITLNTGSSGNFSQSAVQVLDWKINGIAV